MFLFRFIDFVEAIPFYCYWLISWAWLWLTYPFEVWKSKRRQARVSREIAQDLEQFYASFYEEDV